MKTNVKVNETKKVGVKKLSTNELIKVTAKKVATKKDVIKKTKEEIAEKRKLNPQFSHVVSKQKKIDLIEFKSNGLKVLLSAKGIVKNIDIEGYNFAENLNVIEKSIAFINFVTKTTKQGTFSNEQLLKDILNNVRTTKTGFYNEFYFAQLVQKIVSLSIAKGYDYNTALNIVIALNEKAKKAKK
jgi:GH25 family lysozyme M1 (1,4-beta-N-acetylmuramidase)